MKKKYKRIPFDLEMAKAITKGEKEGRVVMRNNKPIRLISFSIDDRFCPILGITDNWDGTNTAYQFTIDGGFLVTKQTNENDLFLEVPDEQEFKEGNVVTFNFGGAARIAIIKSFTGCKLFYPYVELVLCTKYLAFGGQSLFEDIRLATEEEIQILIDALKKDNSNKAREYLKRFFGIDAKPKFNDKDWVLIRSIKTEKWDLSRFGYYSGIEEYPYSVLNGNLTKYCIPYNEQTKHLLGTTNDWEE